MTFPIGLSQSPLARALSESRAEMARLQQQLATGKAVTNYVDLGPARVPILAARAEIAGIGGYMKTIESAGLRLEVMQLALGRISDIASTSRSAMLAGGFEPGAGGQTPSQIGARGSLGELVSLLNSEVAGRYLFGGRQIETPPVAGASAILDGENGAAGFRQVAAERRLADLGDGLGRLEITTPVAGTVTLAEDAVSPFGFKIAGVTSSLTGTTVTGPAGTPASLDVAFGGTPSQDGETITIRLALPDGTETTITLTARTGSAGDGEFQIGANAAATGANFAAALDTALRGEATASLAAASTQAAADDFFNAGSANPPQRVDGPPFDTATSLRDATPADTVLWYNGETGPGSARSSALARVGDDQFVAYGARADEPGLRETMKQLAILSAETFSPGDASASQRYQAMRSRAAEALGFPVSGSPNTIIAELASAQSAINNASERHEASSAVLDDLIAGHEQADIYEVSAKLLALQTKIQASLQVTASLSQLSLVNYI